MASNVDAGTTKGARWVLYKIAGAVAFGVLLAAGIAYANPPERDLTGGWYAYDYRAGLDGLAPRGNVFQAAVPRGDEVWTNHYQWSIDDPESPDSVLALIRQEQWNTTGGIVSTQLSAGPDVRGSCVSFELRGERLDLHGGQATLWLVSGSAKQRWHSEPFEITDEWTEHTIRVDDQDWHQSWMEKGASPNLQAVLASTNSYGIAFVGFGDTEPTGLLGMRGWRFGC